LAKKTEAKKITYPPITPTKVIKSFNQVQKKLDSLELDLKQLKKEMECFVQHPFPPIPTKPPKR
jgi:hypothetical protein